MKTFYTQRKKDLNFVSPLNWENKFMFFFIQGLIFVLFLKKKYNGKIHVLDARQVKTFNRTNLGQ